MPAMPKAPVARGSDTHVPLGTSIRVASQRNDKEPGSPGSSFFGTATLPPAAARIVGEWSLTHMEADCFVCIERART